MKFNKVVASSSANNEDKEFDYQSVVNFPSKGARTVEHTITLLEGEDFDLSPLMQDENGKNVANPDCDIMVVHSLPKKVNGHNAVIGNKRLIPFTATRASAHLAIGQDSAFYDKLVDCELANAMDKWKKVADELKKKGGSSGEVNKLLKYRRSNLVYIKCFLWESKVTENNETKVVPVNKPVLMGFDVKDLFWSDKSGFGVSLVENSCIQDEGETINMFDDNKFVWSTSALKVKPIKPKLTPKEQEMIDGLRKEVKEGKLDKLFENLYPLKYNDFIALVEKGEAKIELPEVQTASSQKSLNKVSIKDLPEEVAEELGDDMPPF